METELLRFAAGLQADLDAEFVREGDAGLSRSEALTRVFIEALLENGHLEEGEGMHYQAGRMRVSGYGLPTDSDRLDLFVTLHNGGERPQTVPQVEVDRALRSLGRFASRVLGSGVPLHTTLEPALPSHDMARRIGEHREQITRLRLHLFTDGLVRDPHVPDTTLEGRPVTHEVWDLRRLYRDRAHRLERRPLEIDLVASYGQGVPCLESPVSGQEFQVYLALFPGTVLAQIYRDHGPRLLERNVRSFLQATGGVNRGIRGTLLREPGRFLAYNNGISATASGVETTAVQGRTVISRIHDFQIVNGGQTTASLHRAMVRDRADLSGVQVQAKISIVNEAQMLEVVPLISRYANSQNRIQVADLAANDSFHIGLEQLSQVLWSPSQGRGEPTQWFYERARGQYRDAEAREPTTVRKKRFRQRYPRDQTFSKVDVARFVHTWEGQPEVVSRGNQKNFAAFSLRLTGSAPVAVDRELFQRLVALALMFRRAGERARVYPAYRANIVAYTLAWIIHASEHRLNLDQIWQDQQVSAPLDAVIGEVMPGVQQAILQRSGGHNVTEWCKRPVAWQQIRALELLPAGHPGGLLLPGPITLLRAGEETPGDLNGEMDGEELPGDLSGEDED